LAKAVGGISFRFTAPPAKEGPFLVLTAKICGTVKFLAKKFRIPDKALS